MRLRKPNRNELDLVMCFLGAIVFPEIERNSGPELFPQADRQLGWSGQGIFNKITLCWVRKNDKAETE